MTEWRKPPEVPLNFDECSEYLSELVKYGKQFHGSTRSWVSGYLQAKIDAAIPASVEHLVLCQTQDLLVYVAWQDWSS